MMAGRVTCLLVAILLGAGPAPTTRPGAAGDAALALRRAQEEVFRRAAAKVAPAVVTIETVGGTQPGSGPGAGFLVGEGPTTGLVFSADGLILTSAFNFVRDPSVITVTLADGRRFVGELLARDELRQLAMLKITATDLPTPEWLTGDDALRVGQWAIALGCGLTANAADPDASPAAPPSMNVGVISGLGRMSGLAVQTDARLSPANFGGPLVDVQGRVIGVCVPMGVTGGELAGAAWYDSGIGFAIPHAQVRASAEALAVGHTLRRGLLGIVVDPKVRDTVRIAAVAEPSPAARAGMQIGDRIIAAAGQPVMLYPDLKRALRPHAAGELITIRVERDGRQIELPVVLAVPEDIGDLPTSQPAPEEAGPESRPADADGL